MVDAVHGPGEAGKDKPRTWSLYRESDQDE